MTEERRAPKNKNNRQIFDNRIAEANARRAMICSLICTLTSSLILILINTLVLHQQPELTKFVLPGAFYAVLTGAFAALLFAIQKKKEERYYGPIAITAMAANFFYLCFMAVISMKNLHSIAFYCIGVIAVSYTLFVNNVVSVASTAVELVSLFVVVLVSSKMGVQIQFSQIVVIIATHAFSFLLSRDIYEMKTDITRQQFRAEREMKQAEIDPLTGLINRRGLEREVNPILEVCQQANQTVGVMIIDIDRFKVYNDAFGHMQGDECLKMVAKSIYNSVGEYGYASRIGGEEFLVFMYDMTFSEMIMLAEKVRRDVKNLKLQHATAPGAVVTISVGCYVETASDDLTFDVLYKKADDLLYKAKKEGRNRVITNKKIVPVTEGTK